jgi:hypothetical protein
MDEPLKLVGELSLLWHLGNRYLEGLLLRPELLHQALKLLQVVPLALCQVLHIDLGVVHEVQRSLGH